MQSECFLAYHSYLEICSSLSDVEFGRLMRAALKYSSIKEITELTGNEKHLFMMLKINIDRDSQKYAEKCESNRINGAMGGRPKKEKPNGFESTQTVFQKPIKNKIKNKNKIINPLSTNVDIPLFEKFWSVYPKKVAKQAAEKAFAKLNLSEATLNVILAGVRKWAETEQWQNDGGRFIPNPATFLNGKRWEDEMPERSETHGSDESEVGRRAQCTEFLDVESTDGSKLSPEEIARIRAENEEFAKLGV